MRRDVIEIITYLEGAKRTAQKPGVKDLLEPQQSEALQGGFNALLEFFESFLGTLPLPGPAKGLEGPKKALPVGRKLELDAPMASHDGVGHTVRRGIELD
tara:strand:+ start:3811 stop:4110 length:300 start_codon:yes stop_codon:yes gene_type:complete